MASKTKRQATEAMAKLKEYLRRDTAGATMLAIIVRYVGFLRQSQTALKEECESLRRIATQSQDEARALSVQRADFKDQLVQEQANHQQTKNDLAKIRKVVSATQYPDIDELLDERNVSSGQREAVSLMKIFKKQGRRAPQGRGICPLSMPDFYIDDFLVDGVRDYTYMGQMVTLLCMASYPVVFKGENREGAVFTDKFIVKFLVWMGGWLGRRISSTEVRNALMPPGGKQQEPFL